MNRHEFVIAGPNDAARALAWIFLVAAVMVLTADVTRAVVGHGSVDDVLAAHWNELSPSTLAVAAAFVQRSLHPKLWDPVMVRLLILPTWMLLGAIGALFAVLARRKARTNIFAN